MLGDWFSEFCGRTRKREENDAYEGLPEIKTNSIYAPSVEGMSENWISFEIIKLRHRLQSKILQVRPRPVAPHGVSYSLKIRSISVALLGPLTISRSL